MNLGLEGKLHVHDCQVSFITDKVGKVSVPLTVNWCGFEAKFRTDKNVSVVMIDDNIRLFEVYCRISRNIGEQDNYY